MVNRTLLIANVLAGNFTAGVARTYKMTHFTVKRGWGVIAEVITRRSHVLRAVLNETAVCGVLSHRLDKLKGGDRHEPRNDPRGCCR